MARDDDPYEIIPHQLLADLKTEVSVLKEKLTGPDTVTHELISSMQDLQKSIKSLQAVFSQVEQEMKSEEGKDPHEQIMIQLKEVTDQNEQIARGMVAIADMVEKFAKTHRPMPAPPMRPPTARVIPPQHRQPMRPPRPPMPHPTAPMNKPMAPPPMRPSAPMPAAPGQDFSKVEGGMPPPPPPPQKKSSFISKIFHKKK